MFRLSSVAAVLSTALVTMSLLSAQTGAERDLTVRFLAERLPEGIGEVAIAIGESRGEAFELPRNNLSERKSPGVRAFEIRASEPDARLARVRLPERGNDFVVILVPAAGGGYQAIPVPVDADFRPGDVFFYNHTSKVVLGYIGSSRFTLDAANGRIVRPAGAREENFYDVGFGVREDDADRPLSLTRWPVTTTSRVYVFFFEHPESGRIDFRAVDEYVPPPQAAGR